MGPRIIRCGDLVLTRWKNGGGTTAEVLADPPGAGLDAFDWRVSMADVATAGPFSTFPDTDRTLVLIEGEALDLEVDGRNHRLDHGSRTLTFSGEARTSAKLPAGPIRDLNVMTRRERFSHEVSLVAENRDGPGTILILAALQDGVLVAIDGRAYQLGRFDVLIQDPWPAEVVSSHALVWISLTRL